MQNSIKTKRRIYFFRNYANYVNLPEISLINVMTNRKVIAIHESRKIEKT